MVKFLLWRNPRGAMTLDKELRTHTEGLEAYAEGHDGPLQAVSA